MKPITKLPESIFDEIVVWDKYPRKEHSLSRIARIIWINCQMERSSINYPVPSRVTYMWKYLTKISK